MRKNLGKRRSEDQPDPELNVSLTGSRVRAAERDRSAGQTAEVSVVAVAETPQPKSFECGDVVGQRVARRKTFRNLEGVKVVRKSSVPRRLSRTRRKLAKPAT